MSGADITDVFSCSRKLDMLYSEKTQHVGTLAALHSLTRRSFSLFFTERACEIKSGQREQKTCTYTHMDACACISGELHLHIYALV